MEWGGGLCPLNNKEREALGCIVVLEWVFLLLFCFSKFATLQKCTSSCGSAGMRCCLVCCQMEAVRQVSSAPDWGGAGVAIATRDVRAGEGARFTCRCLPERTGCVRAA